jgi:pyridoxal phosphate enzyme (YggS family)
VRVSEGAAARLAGLRARIARAAARAGRAADVVTLVGVAKRHAARDVADAVRAGLEVVGENYLQEAQAKIPEVAALLAAEGRRPPRWHFVGRVQRNKARQVASLFEVVETVDSVALGAELDRRATAQGRRVAVLFQVNLCDEPQKGGVAPDALPALVDASGAWESLDPIGLMTLPPPTDDPEAARPAFAGLRELLEKAPSLPRGGRLRELSMGMSADFEVAIEEGATIVRIGTALFGARGRGER